MFKFCGSLFSDLLNKTLRSLPAWILWFRGSGRVAKAVRPGQDSRPSFTSSTWCRRNISKTMFSSFLQVLSVQSPRKVDHIKILLEMRELLSQLIVTKIYPKKRGRPVWPCYYSLERSVVERSVAASCFRDERRETWPSPLAGGAMCPLCGWASCAHLRVPPVRTSRGDLSLWGLFGGSRVGIGLRFCCCWCCFSFSLQVTLLPNW